MQNPFLSSSSPPGAYADGIDVILLHWLFGQACVSFFVACGIFPDAKVKVPSVGGSFCLSFGLFCCNGLQVGFWENRIVWRS